MQQKQSDNPFAVERAIDELRRLRGIVLLAEAEAQCCLPLEAIDEARFKQLPEHDLRLVVSGARMKQSVPAVQISVNDLSFEQVRALADPLAPSAKLPSLAYAPASETGQCALLLAKQASLLPAVLIFKCEESWPEVKVEDIRRYHSTPAEAVETAQAKLPLEGAENARLISFRSPGHAAVHLALVIGDLSPAKNPKGVLTRVHSSCVTGDILGSMRCDCGDQLHLSIEEIKKAGNGVLVYLHQEGRGIGITNKLRAYALQEQGVDTYDANLMLGFDEDERDFSIAAAILKKLGITRIRLLSNNPHKIESLEKHGIAISERVPLVIKTGKHNHAYLDAKAKKSGHLF